MNEQEQLIESYIRGELSAADQAAFEQQIKEDDSLADELRLHLQAQYAILASAEEAEIAKLSARFEQSASARTVPLFGTYSRAIAAAVLLLIGLALALRFFLGSSAQTAPELYAAHFVPLPSPEIRSQTNPQEQRWKEALTLYDQGSLEEMIQATGQLLADTAFRQQSQAQLYVGLAHLQMNQTAPAIEAFSQVSEQSFSYLDAQWYLALAHLKADQPDQAKTVLTHLQSQPTAYRQEEIREIMKQLE
ncbi:MAG: tetratricopeptide repeat protein [Bacteroidota bacterium]